MTKLTMKAALLALMALTACNGEGPIGPMGEPGPPGIDGEDGVNGQDGMDGDNGMDGQPGLVGESCWDATGDGLCNVAEEDLNDDGLCDYLDCQGEEGPAGPQGAMGAQGPQGTTGPQGPAGAAGAQGPAGPQGTTGAQGPQGAMGPQGPAGATGPQGPPGPGAGTFFKNIPAIACIPQDHTNIGDRGNCTSTATVRVSEGDKLPCLLRAIGGTTVQNYVCPLNLPSGALIEEIVLRGRDESQQGYIEGAVLSKSLVNQSEIPGYISPTFGGTWQHTDFLGVTNGVVDIPLYLDSDTPHPVNPNNMYMVAFAMFRSPINGVVRMLGIRVKYTIQ